MTWASPSTHPLNNEPLDLAQGSQQLFAKRQPKRETTPSEFCTIELTWKRSDLSVAFRQPFDLIAQKTTSGPSGRDGGTKNPPNCSSWWAFLDTYRTLCLAPSPEIREIFEQLRNETRKRGKTGGAGMILRFTGGRESDSLWGWPRPQTSMV